MKKVVFIYNSYVKQEFIQIKTLMKKFKLLIISFTVIISCLLVVECNSTQKKFQLDFKLAGGFSQDWEFVNSHNLGFWGFSDSQVPYDVHKGYFFGITMSGEISKSFKLFLNFDILRNSLLLGKAGSYLKGPTIRYSDPNQTSNISPILNNDIYYHSHSVAGKIGLKIGYPISNFNPYIGFAFGIVPFNVFFGNETGDSAYSDIISDVTTISSIIFGADIEIPYMGQKFMNIGGFVEIGGAAASLTITNWIWQGWTYTSSLPIVPGFRLGLSIGIYY